VRPAEAVRLFKQQFGHLRTPTAILATLIVLLAVLSLICGLDLDVMAHGHKEATQIAHLRL